MKRIHALALDRPLGRVGRLVLALGLVLCTAFASVDPLTLLFFLSYAAVGVVLVIRRPRNSIGWLALAIGMWNIPTTARPGMDVAALAAGTASTADFVAFWLGSWAGTASFASLFALMVIFPSGNLPVGRWRRPVIAGLTGGLILVALTAAAPTISFNIDGGATSTTIANRFAVLPDLAFWKLIPADGGLVLPMIFLMAIGAVSMVVRHRRSSGILHLQLRWLVASVAFVVVAFVAAFLTLFVVGDAFGGLPWIPAIVAQPTVPIAIGVAITRYRLYEIDRIVSRTIGWAIVSGILVAVFASLVVGLQALLVGITRGQTLAVAASTLAAFALFQPVRRRVQAAVDRRFDRARYDGERTIAAFARRLRDETDMERVTSDLSGTATSTVAPTSLAIWLRPRGVSR